MAYEHIIIYLIGMRK